METTHVFGELDHLVGVHSSISTDYQKKSNCQLEEGRSRTAVILLTPGMLHHVGPYRLHTHIAKSLSQSGIPSFRFDLSGIGESLAVGSHGSSLSRATKEVQQAMDFLQAEYGYQNFALFGLCSGADDAIPAALADERITAAFLMDGCGYRTRSFWYHYLTKKYLPKLFRWSKWQALFRSLTSAKAEKISTTMPLAFDIREFPERIQAHRDIQSLVDRGVQLHFLYTFGVIEYYSYADQFYEMFPSLRNRSEVQVSYLPNMDHTAMLIEDRRNLVATITRWFSSCIPPSSNQAKSPFTPSDQQPLVLSLSTEPKFETAC